MEEEDPSYLKVRTSDGTEGYVLRQYISSNPPKTQRIDELEIENSGLQKKISELQKTKISLEKQLNGIQEKYAREFSDLTTKSADYEQNLEQSLNNERIITEKYNTLMAQAENVVKIAKERDQLLQKNKKLTTGIKELRNENEKIANSRMIKWFLAGGGVFFFGWIIGKNFQKKTKSSFKASRKFLSKRLLVFFQGPFLFHILKTCYSFFSKESMEFISNCYTLPGFCNNTWQSFTKNINLPACVEPA